MSKIDVENEILVPMQRIYAAPRQYKSAEDVAAALREYERALERFSAEELKAAWAKVVETHDRFSWPVPAIMVSAADRARVERQYENGETRQKQRHKAEAAKVWATWERVRHSTLAQDAVRLGVSWALKQAILSGVDPGAVDLRRFVRSKESAAALHVRLENGLELFGTDGRSKGVMRGSHREEMMRLYHGIRLAEAQTQEEIAFTGKNALPVVEYEGLVP